MAACNTDCCVDLRQHMDTRLFKALCDPTRIELLCHLADHPDPQRVGELSERSPVDTSVVSRHLAVLRDAGVVEATRQGKEVFYCICADGLADTLRAMADAIEQCCPPQETKSEGAPKGAPKGATP